MAIVYYIKKVDSEEFWSGSAWAEEPQFYASANEAAQVMRRVGRNEPSPLQLKSTELCTDEC